MTLLLSLAFILLLISYLVWWDRLYGPPPENPDLTARPPIEATYKFNHWLPRLILWIRVRDPEARAKKNFAVTLPHPFKRKLVILVARHYITARHRKHEHCGHGWQVVLMGPVDYTPTYVWHFILRKASDVLHMMERQARLIAATTRAVLGDLGVVPT